MEEQIAGPVHTADETKGVLEGAYSPLLPLAADLGSVTEIKFFFLNDTHDTLCTVMLDEVIGELLVNSGPWIRVMAKKT